MLCAFWCRHRLVVGVPKGPPISGFHITSTRWFPSTDISEAVSAVPITADAGCHRKAAAMALSFKMRYTSLSTRNFPICRLPSCISRIRARRGQKCATRRRMSQRGASVAQEDTKHRAGAAYKGIPLCCVEVRDAAHPVPDIRHSISMTAQQSKAAWLVHRVFPPVRIHSRTTCPTSYNRSWI